MVPVELVVLGCLVVVASTSVYVYLRRATTIHVSGVSDDEDEDDSVRVTGGRRASAESDALIDGDGDSLELKPKKRRPSAAANGSMLAYFGLLFGSLKKPTEQKATLMHRRNKGIKKVHKPYFYPLLDETAQWYADWESKRQQVASPPHTEIVEVRIDKPKDAVASSLSSRDLLDGLDCVSLVSFRSSSHTIIPVSAM